MRGATANTWLPAIEGLTASSTDGGRGMLSLCGAKTRDRIASMIRAPNNRHANRRTRCPDIRPKSAK